MGVAGAKPLEVGSGKLEVGGLEVGSFPKGKDRNSISPQIFEILGRERKPELDFKVRNGVNLKIQES